jgi:hypothetical protein
MSLNQAQTPMIAINLSLPVEHYKLYDEYIEVCRKELGVNVTPEEFFMSNVLYWTERYQNSTKKEVKSFKEEIKETNNVLNNILSDKFLDTLVEVQNDDKKNTKRQGKTKNIKLKLDVDTLHELAHLKALTQIGLGKKVSTEDSIIKCIKYAHRTLIGEVLNE